MKRVVCLISGRGSNLHALIEVARAERWRETIPAVIVAVLSNRPDAPGLHHAREAGIDAEVLDHTRFGSRGDFDAALAEQIDARQPDLVVLAGFMRVLTAEFVARYAGRLVNIHPSLLPAFPGLGTHRQALAAGVRVHGCTVHFVSGEVDGGAVIAQAAVPVWPDDTEESLAARVLVQEHALLPSAVRWLLEGRVRLAGGRAVAEPSLAGSLARFATEVRPCA